MDALRAALGIGLLGCLLAACQTAEPETGLCIGKETLKQIEKGKTPETWLRAVIGEPTSEAEIEGDPGLKVLHYSTVQATDQSMFDALMGIPGERTVGTIYFMVRDGVVVHFWADGMEEWRLFGGGKGAAGEKANED